MYELILTMTLMHPGSNISIQNTVLGQYNTLSQCENAKKYLDIKYNTSLGCIRIEKKKI
jgi:hypothetical protein